MKVWMIATMSADGLLGEHEGHNSRDWRSKVDGIAFSRLIKRAKVMVMGSTTYKTFRMNRAPFKSRMLVYTHDPSSIAGGEGIETTDKDPAELVKQLESEGYTTLAVCGGSTINSLFLDAGLVDEVYLTVEPVLFGQGVPLLTNAATAKLTLLECTSHQSGAVMLRYAVDK